MSYTSMSSPTFFGEVNLGATVGEAWGGPVPISCKISYINSTNHDITIVQRSGFRATIPAKPNFRSRSFIIREEWHILPEVKENVRAVLNGVDEDSSAVMKLMKSILQESDKQMGRHARANLILDHPISVEQLEHYGRSVYHHETDCVISMLGLFSAPLHPYSEEGRNKQMLVDAPVKIGEKGFGYCVEVVDNTGRFGDRFINITNQIYRVRSTKDPTRRDGIYLGSNEPDGGEFSTGKYHVKHIPLDAQDQESFGLYRSYEDAMNLGDMTMSRKRELASIEHETVQLKRELEQVKHRHDLEMAERDHLLKIIEAKLKEAEFQRDRREAELKEERTRAEHLMALEKLRVKDHYEEKSLDRKDRSEVVKILPALITGLAAAFVAIRAIMTASK